MKHKDQEEQQLNKKRQIFTNQIRKNNREEIITKRRNYNTNVDKQLVKNIQQQSSFKQQTQILNQKIQEILKKTYTPNDFITLVQFIHSDDPIKNHEGIIGIRKILSVEKNAPIQIVIDANLVPKMIQFIKQTKYPRLQMEATWALTNVASGTSYQCQSIIDKGGIPLFIKLMESANQSIVQQAIWAIGNISGDSPFNRDLILKLGGLKPLRLLVQNSKNNNIVKHGAWALSNLCRGTPLPKFQLVKQAISTFGKVVKEGLIDQQDIITDCVWALSYLSDGPKNHYVKIIQTGVVPILVNYLKTPKVGLIVPALRTLGNLVSGTQSETEQVLRHDPIPALENLLSHEKKFIRKQVCWFFSNVGAGNKSQVLRVLSRTSLVQRLISILQMDTNETRRQIFWLFSNITQRLQPTILVQFIQHYKILKVFAHILSTVEDAKTLQIALKALFNIFGSAQQLKGNGKNILVLQFNSYGTLDCLQKLQYHRQEDVYNDVVKILQAYYQIQDPLS